MGAVEVVRAVATAGVVASEAGEAFRCVGWEAEAASVEVWAVLQAEGLKSRHSVLLNFKHYVI